MDSPSKAKREAYKVKLRSQASAASAKSGEGPAPAKSVGSGAQEEAEPKGKGREAAAGALSISAELGRKALKEALEGALHFTGDEDDIFKFASGVKAAYDALVLFAESWVDCPLPWTSVRTLFPQTFKGLNSMGNWARNICAPAEGARDAVTVLERFEAEFFTVEKAVKASRAWHEITLRANEKPKEMFRRMRQLEALMETPPSQEFAAAVFLKGLPVDLRINFGVAQFKSPEEVCERCHAQSGTTTSRERRRRRRRRARGWLRRLGLPRSRRRRDSATGRRRSGARPERATIAASSGISTESARTWCARSVERPDISSRGVLTIKVRPLRPRRGLPICRRHGWVGAGSRWLARLLWEETQQRGFVSARILERNRRGRWWIPGPTAPSLARRR